MKTAYFDCFAGIAGDMVLGALVDLGLDIEKLKAELQKLNVSGWDITAEKVKKKGIAGTHVTVVTEEQKAHRHLHHITDIINNSALSDSVKDKSTAIFSNLAEAEAKVHDTTIDKIHFHEVGALDAIVDIVGTVVGLELLGIGKISSSPIVTGYGFVDCEHGKMPVPAPATAELLKDVPSYAGEISKELTTPTGAAIITTLGTFFGARPQMKIERVGYGAGTRDLEIPNLLRVMVGTEIKNAHDTDRVTLIETNIDDMNPQFYNYVTDKLYDAGALDVYTTAVTMKKNRPGILLTVLVPEELVDSVTEIIFSETTTIGVRLQNINRRKLRREIVTVKTQYGEVRVKVSFSGKRKLNIMPEYDDCRKIAAEKDVPIQTVFDEARTRAREQS